MVGSNVSRRAVGSWYGAIAQRQSIPLTRGGSLVQSQLVLRMEMEKYELTKAVLDSFNKKPGAHVRIGQITAERWTTKRIPPPFQTSVDLR